jgi:hypothetical protein
VPQQGQLGDGPGAQHADRQHHVGLQHVQRAGLERAEQFGRGPGHLPARHPDQATQRAHTVQVTPGSGSSSQNTPRSASSAAIRRTWVASSAGEASPGIRHHWFRSAMRAISSPTAARVARRAARLETQSVRDIGAS